MTAEKELFEQFKRSLLNLDPVEFCQKYLTLDGKPFRLIGNGYKPFVDIYRYIGIKALERDAKPMILLKSRQNGGSTMALALEMYFMGCGLFGTGSRPPVRVIHAFPQLEMAAQYSKTKLGPMINSSVIEGESKTITKNKTYMQKLLDTSSSSAESLSFKQFVNGNFIMVDSTGVDADRLRGRTADIIFYDECFPYDQYIETINGNIKIGKLHDDFKQNNALPLVKTFNENLNIFEYKKILNTWKRNERQLIEITTNNLKIKCTPNHRFLTENGWLRADQFNSNIFIKSNFKNECVVSVELLNEYQVVYDIEVENNHNFIVTSSDKNSLGLIAHNCQDTSGTAISNANKILNKSQYGGIGNGVQVYFGTPKKKGSDFYKMWEVSSQKYYYLGCENCKGHFPLYTPGSDEWEKIWLHGFIVKCTLCGHEQDKRPAAERGKWISSRNEEESLMVGYHINQVYMPEFTKEHILSQKPGIHPINTERAYQNEVLGEFFQGDSSPLTPEEIRELAGDPGRKMRARIEPGQEKFVVLGIDYGARADLEQLADVNKSKMAGQSYSTAVVMVAKGPGLLSIEFATKFKKNDIESKKNLIDSIMRQYSVELAIGDIGYSNDFSSILHNSYGDKYLVSRAHNKINDKIKFNQDAFPKEIIFERDYYIGELFEQIKKGMVRFPYGDYEKIAWLISHCSSMDIKPSISRYGDPSIHYVKGSGPNDGFMALLNAYIAYKFLITKGFSSNNPFAIQNNMLKHQPLVTLAHIKRKM